MAGALAGMGACGGGDGNDGARSSPAPTSSDRAATEPPAAAPGATDLREAGATAISLDSGWLTAGADGVWSTNENGVVRLDPSTGRVVATIRLPEGVPCLATETGFGALWTATCGPGGLARVDPARDQATDHVRLPVAVALGPEGSIGVGTGGIWVVVDGPNCTGCRLVRVDPKTMRVTATVTIDDGSHSVRTGAGFVWVTNPDANAVQQVHPGRERVVRTVDVGVAPFSLAVAHGAAWTLNQVDGTITRVDARTGRTTTIAADLAGGGGNIAAGGGWIWARAGAALLSRIDPRTNKVVERYGPAVGSGTVAVGYRAVWISAHDNETVWRLPIPAR